MQLQYKNKMYIRSINNKYTTAVQTIQYTDAVQTIKYTAAVQTIQSTTAVQTTQNTLNTSTHITKTPTHYRIHALKNPHTFTNKIIKSTH
jgi:hypothetical protein